jgi:Spy/CpxP family protein refolding chaperone
MKLKPWLVLALIFVVGMATGGALTVVLAPHFRHAPGPQQVKGRWLMQLTRKLNLTSEQQAKIEPILTDADSQIQSMRQDQAERLSQIIVKTNRQIATILTPEQQTELQKMEKEMDQNRDKMFPGRMRPWGLSHDGPGGMHRHDGTMPPDAPTNAAPPAPQNP